MTPLWLLQQWCWTYDTVQSMFHVPICATNICMCFFLRRKILQQPVKGHLWYGYAPLNCICIGKMVTNHRKFTSSLVFQKKQFCLVNCKVRVFNLHWFDDQHTFLPWSLRNPYWSQFARIVFSIFNHMIIMISGRDVVVDMFGTKDQKQ
jgi:hypothetical protein